MNASSPSWISTQEKMPVIGQKIMAFLWMDKVVCQAWWNGERYVVVAADEQGKVVIYEVLPIAISHWQTMPEIPEISNSVQEEWQTKLNGTMH